ncbi:hypothetical protein [Klenkia sp. PcliD-1-E]|uniref:hypothetical protein n=1 Tax=Klenkia sp. PcliD-1-E TaxID=2954492 RepID=UPI002097FAD4|nr:hypothetical protein [Klenkia sp. PcliD-1-E]MCO7222331.1 hypothetical protein [Klenkia sp. PcliD-1-E]
MRARLGWVLLMLGAVFAVHGLQCAATEPVDAVAVDAVDAVAVHMGSSHAVSSHAVSSSPIGVAALPVADGDGGWTTADPSDRAAASSTAHGAPAGHSAAAHAAMVCLAVLAGGVGVALAALAAWLARRRVGARMAAVQRSLHLLPDRLRALPPGPDLARLCVLRI